MSDEMQRAFSVNPDNAQPTAPRYHVVDRHRGTFGTFHVQHVPVHVFNPGPNKNPGDFHAAASIFEKMKPFIEHILAERGFTYPEEEEGFPEAPDFLDCLHVYGYGEGTTIVLHSRGGGVPLVYGLDVDPRSL